MMLEEPADSFAVEVQVTLPDPVVKHLRRAEDARASAAAAQADAAREVRLAATELQRSGMSLRDIGRALGVSYQRAHQLVSSG